MDASETDDESLVGEACHMVARSEDGPRGESDLTAEQRDKYANLLLLCNVHHKQIDDQVSTFPVERLLEKKRSHEDWVRESLNFDPLKQREEEILADYVDEWSRRIDLCDWKRWTSSLMSGDSPSMRKDRFEALEEIRPWLLSRAWPERYPELVSAFLNFRVVAQDLCRVFSEDQEDFGGDWVRLRKFYKINDWDEEPYARLSKQYDDTVDLIGDLLCELTRAANYVCDQIRRFLIPSYRLSEGVLLIEGGPYMDMSYKNYRVEYRGEERVAVPYPGLEQFKTARFGRDLYFGDRPPEAQQGAAGDV